MNLKLFNIIDAPKLAEALPVTDMDFSAWLQYSEKRKAEMLSESIAQDKPVFVHTLGCPASGKTTLLQYCRDQGDFPVDSIYLSFDRLMEEFSGYQDDVAQHGMQIAFEKHEVPARALGYEMLELALNEKRHVVLEHSGARADHVSLLKAVKEQLGYHIFLLEAQCSLEIAKPRVRHRPRHLPEGYLEQRRKIIDELRSEYYLLSDEVRRYNTENLPPVLLEQK
jgi:predicted kinase